MIRAPDFSRGTNFELFTGSRQHTRLAHNSRHYISVSKMTAKHTYLQAKLDDIDWENARQSITGRKKTRGTREMACSGPLCLILLLCCWRCVSIWGDVRIAVPHLVSNESNACIASIKTRHWLGQRETRASQGDMNTGEGGRDVLLFCWCANMSVTGCSFAYVCVIYYVVLYQYIRVHTYLLFADNVWPYM